MAAGRRALRSVLVVAILSGLAAAATAWLLIRWDGERIDVLAEADLQSHLAGVVASLQAPQVPTDQANAWLIRTDTPTVTPLGPTDVEPPVLTLAQSIGDSGTAEQRVDVGKPLLLGALSVPDKTGQNQTLAVVTAISLGGYDAQKTSHRPLIIGGVAAATLLACLIAFAFSLLQIRRQGREAERQRAFLSDAAHELRTPLSVIQASAGQALARERSGEEYVRSLSEIRGAAERAGIGVAELLDLARLEGGQAVPRKGPLRLDLLVEEVASGVRVDGVEIEVVSGDPVVVEADMSLLRQAVANVILNASTRAHHVRLTTSRQGRHAVVEAVDDGPGFSEEMLPHVFHRFRRGDRSGGAGLGLAIVRRVVEAHGGQAEVENREGGGAVVRLRLPAGRA